MAADGSRVFHHFGWDLPETMRAVALFPMHGQSYASDEFGHSGPGLVVFRLRKGPEAPA